LDCHVSLTTAVHTDVLGGRVYQRIADARNILINQHGEVKQELADQCGQVRLHGAEEFILSMIYDSLGEFNCNCVNGFTWRYFTALKI
jgi:hypothetical protein